MTMARTDKIIVSVLFLTLFSAFHFMKSHEMRISGSQIRAAMAFLARH
jgi:hypothetical protein